MKKEYILGLMSGSSLDGLDIALCQFSFDEKPEKGQIEWKILEADTIPYSEEWIDRLRKLPTSPSTDLYQADAALGGLFGEMVSQFLTDKNIQPSLVASHGHTIFHYPEKGFTVQIGHGSTLSEKCQIPVLYDLRMSDIAAGGQGAPFAPIVDEWLFPEYDFFLNLGGIANIACKTTNGYIGYDVIGANQTLDALARSIHLDYDHNGLLAKKGQINPVLYQQIQDLPFLQEPHPKSLDNQWVAQNMTQPVLDFDDSVSNKLNTIVEIVAKEIGHNINQLIPFTSGHQLLITGGGAHNGYLIERIQHYCDPKVKVTIPAKKLINNKESLLIALMGLLYKYKIPNSSPSVTGATHNTIGGVLAT